MHSPVPSEPQSSVTGVVQNTVDTVKSYFAGLSLGGSKTTEDQEARNAGEENTTTGSGSAVDAVKAGAAVSASAVAASAGYETASNTGANTDGSNENKETSGTAPTDSAERAPGTTSKDENMADSAKKDDNAKAAETTEQSSESEEKKDESSTGGGKSTGKLENRDAIPMAGGERLGEHHWGESKMLPDNAPPPQEQKVSSAEGQPDSKVSIVACSKPMSLTTHQNKRRAILLRTLVVQRHHRVVMVEKARASRSLRIKSKTS